MISYLKGKIIKKGISFVILDVNNIGYKVFVNENMAADFSANETAEIFVHQHTREDGVSLYGFKNYEQLELFELLLSVSGVGPKIGLAILMMGDSEEIKQAIAAGDIAFLSKVSGVGRKTAERIVLDLRDKVGALTISEKFSASGISSRGEEIDALMALGYSMQQARDALSKIDKSITDSGQRIREALRTIKN